MNQSPHYHELIYKPMTQRHYERGGWHEVDGQRLTLQQALEYRGDFFIRWADDPIVFRGALQRNMIKSYPPSLWAHGGHRSSGKRVTGC